MTVAVHLEPWGPHDLPLLTRLVGDPKMMEHLGGAESPEKIVDRHNRYLRHDAQDGRMFKIIDEETGKGVGSVGYWPRTWRGEEVYETGWSVLPEFQGRGIAAEATRQVIALARSENRYRFIHAFPSVDNAASNAICRKLGFTLLGESDFEYPKGHYMRCNDWRLPLR